METNELVAHGGGTNAADQKNTYLGGYTQGGFNMANSNFYNENNNKGKGVEFEDANAQKYGVPMTMSYNEGKGAAVGDDEDTHKYGFNMVSFHDKEKRVGVQVGDAQKGGSNTAELHDKGKGANVGDAGNAQKRGGGGSSNTDTHVSHEMIDGGGGGIAANLSFVAVAKAKYGEDDVSVAAGPSPGPGPEPGPRASSLHNSWKLAPLNTTTCETCGSRAIGKKMVHQYCLICEAAICRNCVEEGYIALLPGHDVGADVSSMDWGHMNPSLRHLKLKEREKLAAAASAAASDDGNGGNDGNSGDGGGSGGGVEERIIASTGSDSTGIGYQNSKSDSNSNHVNDDGEANRAGKADLSARPRATLRPKGSNNNKTRANKQKRKHRSSAFSRELLMDEAFDPDNEHYYEMEAFNAQSSDGDYHPPSQTSRKRSASAASTNKSTKRGGRAEASASNAAVGLAKSRPVRASAIHTYEKMRNKKVKTAGDAPGTAAAPQQQQHQVGVTTPDEPGQVRAQKDSHASSFYGDMPSPPQLEGEAYLKASRASNNGQFSGDKLRKKYDPGYEFDHFGNHSPSSSKLAANGSGFMSQVKDNNDNTDHDKQQVPVLSPVKSDADAAGDGQDCKKINESKFLTGNCFMKLSQQMRDAVKALIAAGGGGEQTPERHLRDTTASFWYLNDEIRGARDEDEMTAFQYFRGIVNATMTRLQVDGGYHLKQWLDATELEIQQRAAFVPPALRIQNVDALVENDKSHPVTNEDIQAANILLQLRNDFVRKG